MLFQVRCFNFAARLFFYFSLMCLKIVVMKEKPESFFFLITFIYEPLRCLLWLTEFCHLNLIENNELEYTRKWKYDSKHKNNVGLIYHSNKSIYIYNLCHLHLQIFLSTSGTNKDKTRQGLSPIWRGFTPGFVNYKKRVHSTHSHKW